MNQEVKQYYDRLLIHFELMNLGDRTILIYKGIALKFLCNLSCSPLEVTVEQLELFVLEKNASRSKEQALTVLKHLYRNIFKQPEKVNHIPIPKHDEYLPDILTPQEVFLICNHPTNIKHKAVLTLIYSCALRISEATNIKFEHIDSQRRSLKVKCGKGRKDRLIPLPVETINLLRQYCAEWKPHNRGQFLFGGQKAGEPYSTRQFYSASILAI
jgi:integrase/recombinase XerD